MNIHITEKALKEYKELTKRIRLNPNGKVYLKDEYDIDEEETKLIWNIAHSPCEKEPDTIIITKGE